MPLVRAAFAFAFAAFAFAAVACALERVSSQRTAAVAADPMTSYMTSSESSQRWRSALDDAGGRRRCRRRPQEAATERRRRRTEEEKDEGDRSVKWWCWHLFFIKVCAGDDDEVAATTRQRHRLPRAKDLLTPGWAGQPSAPSATMTGSPVAAPAQPPSTPAPPPPMETPTSAPQPIPAAGPQSQPHTQPPPATTGTPPQLHASTALAHAAESDGHDRGKGAASAPPLILPPGPTPNAVAVPIPSSGSSSVSTVSPHSRRASLTPAPTSAPVPASASGSGPAPTSPQLPTHRQRKLQVLFQEIERELAHLYEENIQLRQRLNVLEGRPVNTGLPSYPAGSAAAAALAQLPLLASADGPDGTRTGGRGKPGSLVSGRLMMASVVSDRRLCSGRRVHRVGPVQGNRKGTSGCRLGQAGSTAAHDAVIRVLHSGKLSPACQQGGVPRAVAAGVRVLWAPGWRGGRQPVPVEPALLRHRLAGCACNNKSALDSANVSDNLDV